MPWAMPGPRKTAPRDAAEVAEAEASLEEGLVFTS